MNPYIIPGLKGKNLLDRKIKTVEIIRAVTDYYQIQEEKLYVKTRKREYLLPRQMAIYLIRYNTQHSLKYIGKMFQGKRPKPIDHTTVIHTCKVINDLLCTDQQMNEDMKNIKQML
jgi:chromosomal replication initiator protein